jgi:hypothetical protein
MAAEAASPLLRILGISKIRSYTTTLRITFNILQIIVIFIVIPLTIKQSS